MTDTIDARYDSNLTARIVRDWEMFYAEGSSGARRGSRPDSAAASSRARADLRR